MPRVLLVFFLMLCSATNVFGSGEGDHKHNMAPKQILEGLKLISEKGLFNVTMSIEESRFLVGVNSVDLSIKDMHGKGVSGAEIKFVPWMPEMGHGVFEDPVLTEKGHGMYRVENIILVMGGHWEIRIGITKDIAEDRVVFNFPYVKTSDEYNYIKAKTPAGFNAVLGMKNPLKELKPEIISEKGKQIKVFKLTVKDMGFEIFPDKPMMGWGFDGQIPGPTIRVTEGDRVRIVLGNESTGEHTMHVHGQKKPVIYDGVPYLGQKPVKKGESYTYEFVASNLGTSWYHCHVDSAHHVDMGMYGAFIVEPKKEKLEYDREYIMILDEWPTAHVHVHESEASMQGHEEHGVVTMHDDSPPVHEHADKKPAKRDWYPKTHAPRKEVYDGFTINGKAFPFTEPVVVKEGEKVRIRFINAGYQNHFMHTHSHKFQVVARDGAYVNEPQKIDTVQVGPGQRADIILFADNPGIWPMHCHRLNHITNEDIYPGGMLTFIQYIE